MTPTEQLKAASTYYLKTHAQTGEVLTEPGRIFLPPLNNATPIKMQPVIDELQRVTTAVAERFPKELPPGAEGVGMDFAAWAQRLAGYRIVQAVEMDSTPTETTQRYWDVVVRPLLLGIYPGDPTQKVADLVTVYTVDRQLDILDQAARDRSVRLWSDLDSQVRRYVDTAADILDKPTKSPQVWWAVGGAAVALGLLYVATR